jgi:TonB-dependent receptor
MLLPECLQRHTMNQTKRAFFVLLLFALVLPTLAVAQQAGRVVGTIVDRSTGDPLIGANVLIQGTTIGAAADIDGRFVIRAVPAGTQTVVASYLGYERQTMVVEVPAGGEVHIDIELPWAGVVGDEVVITAQARGQTQAINEQLAARTITNVVAADRIRELPDESAATAISRMPGISLDGDRVVVRGIQAKMNTVLVNGIQLPATGTEDRGTNLGFISSNMLSGIEVTKAVTPDMDANSIGGVVNLRLREAPVGLRSEVMVQGGYNTQDATFANYQTWASVSNRFLRNRLGVFVQGNLRQVTGGQDQARSVYEPNQLSQQVPESGHTPYWMREIQFVDDINRTRDFGGSVIIDFQLPNGKLAMQNTYAHTSADIERHFDNLIIDAGRRSFRFERDINTRHLLVNALQGENTFGGFSVDYSIAHAQSQKDTDLNYWLTWQPDAIEGWTPVDRVTELPYFTQDDAYRITIGEGLGISQEANESAPRMEEFTERQWTGNLNMTLPVQLSRQITGEFQGGGKVNWLSRENDITRRFARMSDAANYQGAADYMRGLGLDPTRTLVFSDWMRMDHSQGDRFLAGRRTMSDVLNTEMMDEFFRLGLDSGVLGNPHIADSRRSDYTANERLSAGYIMADFAIGPRINLLAGVRYEDFYIDYNGSYTVQTHFMGDGFVVPDSAAGGMTDVQRSVSHWFPNAQLRIGITEWFDIRLAYTRTLSRPDYAWLVPFVFVNRDGRTGQSGNPYLNPTTSENFDAYFSFYTNRIGLFTIGGFYKHMEDVILQQDVQQRYLREDAWWPTEDSGLPRLLQGTAPVRVWLNNPHPARIAGLEFDWQTVFWYLPAPFNSMVMNVNYTKITSEMDYQYIDNRLGPLDPMTGRRDVIAVDTFYTARLLHQGDDIINIALGADVRGFSGRLSFRLQGDVISNVGVRREEDAFSANVYGWDFTIRQNLPVEGLQMFVNGLNITHAPVNQFRRFPQNHGEPIVDNLNRRTYNPRRFDLGFRYTF